MNCWFPWRLEREKPYTTKGKALAVDGKDFAELSQLWRTILIDWKTPRSEELPGKYDQTASFQNTCLLFSSTFLHFIKCTDTNILKFAAESFEELYQHRCCRLVEYNPTSSVSFTEICVLRILPILLGHDPIHLNDEEMICIDNAIRCSIDLVRLDMKSSKSSSSSIWALPHLFDAKQNYYKTYQRQSGTRISRVQVLQSFLSNNGFEDIAKKSCHLSLLNLLVGAARDLFKCNLEDGDSSGNVWTKAELVKQSAEFGYGIMERVVTAVESGHLNRVSAQSLDSLLHNLDDLFDCVSETRKIPFHRFHVSKRKLCLNLLTQSSLQKKLFGWDMLDKMIDKSAKDCPPPEAYWVEGAGSLFCNGRYKFDGPYTEDNYPILSESIAYTRVVPEGEEMAGHKLTIFRCTMRSQKRRWFLSEADQEQPRTDLDTDYYYQDARSMLPPSKLWVPSKEHGVHPAPSMRAERFMKPQEREYISLEYELLKWAIGNEIIEKVFGSETFYIEEVRRSTKLIQFLARMRRFLPADTPYTLNGSHLILLSRFFKHVDATLLAPERGAGSVRKFSNRPVPFPVRAAPFRPMTGDLFRYTQNLVAFESIGSSSFATGIEDSWCNKCVLIGGDGFGNLPYTDAIRNACHASGWSLVQPMISRTFKGCGDGSLDRDVEDILQLIQYMFYHRQAKRVCLVGHGIGCRDICHLLRTQFHDVFWQRLEKDKSINQESLIGSVLFDPVCERECLASSDPKTYDRNLQIAASLCEIGSGQEFMPRSTFSKPITAQRFVDFFKKDGMDDYFSTDSTDGQLAERLGVAGDWPSLRVLVVSSETETNLVSIFDTADMMYRMVTAMNTKRFGVATSLYLPWSTSAQDSSNDEEIFGTHLRAFLEQILENNTAD